MRSKDKSATKVPPAQGEQGVASGACLQSIDLIEFLVALPGLEPGLFALRGRRVNQLHHNAMNGLGIHYDLLSIAKMRCAEKGCVGFEHTLSG
jgi:hypothetical protein